LAVLSSAVFVWAAISVLTGGSLIAAAAPLALRASSPAATATAPLATKVSGTPQASATHPVIGPPIAVLPRKIVV
jgi:hypothetical protein